MPCQALSLDFNDSVWRIAAIMHLTYRILSEQGNREHMEDTYRMMRRFGGRADQFFALLCDGHGGSAVATAAVGELPSSFFEELWRGTPPPQALAKSFAQTSNRVRNYPGGACALAVFIRGDKLFVASAGDSMCYLFSDGNMETLTRPHRVSNPDEERRIRATGGRIEDGKLCTNEEWLVPTRALGDAKFIPAGVSAEPECIERNIDRPGCLLLATDGIWDVIGEECIRGIGTSGKSLQTQKNRLRRAVEENGAPDNYTGILINMVPSA